MHPRCLLRGTPNPIAIIKTIYTLTAVFPLTLFYICSALCKFSELIRRYAQKRYRNMREATLRMSRRICIKMHRQWPLSVRCPPSELIVDLHETETSFNTSTSHAMLCNSFYGCGSLKLNTWKLLPLSFTNAHCIDRWNMQAKPQSIQSIFRNHVVWRIRSDNVLSTTWF